MSDWQERITRETAPAIRAEHELRYRIVAPLIAASSAWADLGCGTGVAALSALGEIRPEHAVLVDVEQEVVAGAARELAVADTAQIAGDLTDHDDLTRIEAALLSVDGERVVSCFEVIEHLSTFIPLLEWSVALAREGDATFVISVPNDAFWSIANPYHLTAWGEGAFEELCRLLPSERTLLRQVALTGSALVDWQAATAQLELTVEVGGGDAVATHFIAAYGPRHEQVRHTALAAQADLLDQRRWERQRESNIAFAEAMAHEQREALASHEQTIVTQRAELRKQTAQFDEWRSYIHELEHELGRPLAGTPQAMAQAGEPAGAHESPPASESVEPPA
jgi:SAM-dependent methyltransferase